MTDNRSRPPEALLAALSRDLRPVRPLAPPSWQAVRMLPLALLITAGVFLVIGLRRDTAVLGPLLAWGASLAQLILGVVLVWIAARESTPGHRLPRNIVLMALGAAVLIVVAITLWTFHARPIVIPSRFSPWRAGLMCGMNSTIAGIFLLVGVALLLGRRSLAERPALVGALFGAGAGIVVNASWRLSCPVSSPSHSLLAHGSPVIIATLAGAILVSTMARYAWRRRSD